MITINIYKDSYVVENDDNLFKPLANGHRIIFHICIDLWIYTKYLLNSEGK